MHLRPLPLGKELAIIIDTILPEMRNTMLSMQPHCRYGRNPLAEVICQFRFPQILVIEADPPAKFQEAIRQQYPLFQKRQEIPAPKLLMGNGKLALPGNQSVTNYQFSSSDGIWRINLTGSFISLSCSRYRSWEEFAARLDQPLAAFLQIYQPAHFDRVGLRYVNFISRQALNLQDIPFRELLQPCYLGPLALEEIPEGSIHKSTVDFEMNLRGGCRVKLHAGPGLVKQGGRQDPEVKFVFDQDLYMPGPLPLNLAVGTLHTLHGQAFSLFRGAVTDTLHEAMEPR